VGFGSVDHGSHFFSHDKTTTESQKPLHDHQILVSPSGSQATTLHMFSYVIFDQRPDAPEHGAIFKRVLP
jgi:hypothetical protein